MSRGRRAATAGVGAAAAAIAVLPSLAWPSQATSSAPLERVVPMADPSYLDLTLPRRSSPSLDRVVAAPRAGVSRHRIGDVAIAPPPAVFHGPPPPAAPPPPQLTSSASSGSPKAEVWAVTIGVNDYPGRVADLDSAVADAGDVDRALGRFRVELSHRMLLLNGQATGDTIRAATAWLVQQAGPEDTVVWFFAGHVRKLDSDTEAVVAADGEMIRDIELSAMLASLRANRTWIGLATCYAGGFTEVLQAGRILTGAADANSLAYENERFGRSYLVQYMVHEGWLEGHAGASVESAFAYARQALREDYPDRMPVQYDLVDGDLRFDELTSSSVATGPGGSSGSSDGTADEDDEYDCNLVVFCSRNEDD